MGIITECHLDGRRQGMFVHDGICTAGSPVIWRTAGNQKMNLIVGQYKNEGCCTSRSFIWHITDQ